MSRRVSSILLALGFGVLLAVPFVMRPAGAGDEEGALKLVIITPHNEQIRNEIGWAFNRWHNQHFGKNVVIDWRVMGTSTMVRQLQSDFKKLARTEDEDIGTGYDVAFGGGDYTFDKQLKPGIRVKGNSGERRITFTVPMTLDEKFATIEEVYGGREKIGSTRLYDTGGHWYGVVLSSFGIAFNRDVLKYAGVDEPKTWSDLSNFDLYGKVALADPAHSGSITVTYQTILNRYGFEKGWKTLRRAAANARYFAALSSKVPLDVAAGEAAVGMCIDFYGRQQAQMVGDDRMGYVAPKGETIVTPDPVAVLRGAKHRETAERFVTFLLTREGQAVWCFKKGEEVDGLRGPARFPLRRPPVRVDLYKEYLDRMMDRVNPYKIAKAFKGKPRGYFRTISPVLSAMAIDVQAVLRKAWVAIHEEKDKARRHKMLTLFDALPFTEEELLGRPNVWKQSPRQKGIDRRAWTTFFEEKYREIIRMGAK